MCHAAVDYGASSVNSVGYFTSSVDYVRWPLHVISTSASNWFGSFQTQNGVCSRPKSTVRFTSTVRECLPIAIELQNKDFVDTDTARILPACVYMSSSIVLFTSVRLHITALPPSKILRLAILFRRRHVLLIFCYIYTRVYEVYTRASMVVVVCPEFEKRSNSRATSYGIGLLLASDQILFCHCSRKNEPLIGKKGNARHSIGILLPKTCDTDHIIP